MTRRRKVTKLNDRKKPKGITDKIMKTRKIFFLALLFFLYAGIVCAQRPVISSISKTSTAVNETITISGSNFGTNASYLKVNFGAVQGEVISATATAITVKVPAGTTFSSVSVTNINSRLTGYSSSKFGLAPAGETFNVANFQAQQDFAAGQGIFDLCLCDFDGDGLSDVATANDVATDVGLFRNTSTISTISFAARQALALGVSSPTKNVNCGDIDGDGRPDLVVSGDGSSYGNTIFIFRNISVTGALTFLPPVKVTLNTNGAARIAIRDLDLDGKPELIATNRSESKVTIFPNTSTVGSISFGTSLLLSDIPCYRYRVKWTGSRRS